MYQQSKLQLFSSTYHLERNMENKLKGKFANCSINRVFCENRHNSCVVVSDCFLFVCSVANYFKKPCATFS